MFVKLSKEYKKLSGKLEFFSKLSAFFLSVFSLLSLYIIGWLNYSEVIAFFTPDEIVEFWVSIIFQLAVFIVFTSRFILLFFKTEKTFWFSQILSFFGLIILAFYWLVSRPPDGYYQFFPDEWVIFHHALQPLQGIGLYYLILSPTRKFLTLIVAFFKSK